MIVKVSSLHEVSLWTVWSFEKPELQQVGQSLSFFHKIPPYALIFIFWSFPLQFEDHNVSRALTVSAQTEMQARLDLFGKSIINHQ